MEITFSDGFKRYFANTSWLLGGRMLSNIVSFFVVVYVVRYLGPEQFGLLSYATSFVFLFSVFSMLGLNSIVVRELVKSPEKQHELLGTAFLMKVIGSVLALLLIAIAMQFTNNDRFTNLLIFIIAASLVFKSFNVIDFYFQSCVQSKYVVIAQTNQIIISSIIKLVLVAIEAPLLWFAMVALLDSIVFGIGLAVMYIYNRQRVLRWHARFGVGIALLRDSWPLILSGIAISVYMRIDQIMIKEMLDNESVGNYAVAVKLCEVWYFLPMLICNSLFPAILNAKQKNNALYYNRLQRLYDFMAWLAIGIALPLSFFSDTIINLLFGEKYLQAAPVLSIYIWAGVFVFLGVASSQWLIAENYTKISFMRTFMGLIVNVSLNLVLIPIYGIKGAAWATLVSYAIAVFSIVLYNKARQAFFMMLKSFFPLSKM